MGAFRRRDFLVAVPVVLLWVEMVCSVIPRQGLRVEWAAGLVGFCIFSAGLGFASTYSKVGLWFAAVVGIGRLFGGPIEIWVGNYYTPGQLVLMAVDVALWLWLAGVLWVRRREFPAAG